MSSPAPVLKAVSDVYSEETGHQETDRQTDSPISATGKREKLDVFENGAARYSIVVEWSGTEYRIRKEGSRIFADLWKRRGERERDDLNHFALQPSPHLSIFD